VRTNSAHLDGKTGPLPILPGMVATVEILTGRKSVLEYLLKPVLKVRDSALRER
jgi:adhesin transport system membrane fusion protein